MKSFGLNRNQLKLLAILAMVVDHTAWGFVEFMSPLGQAMHLFGRLTLPIMCFFIAEGFKHTSDIRRYVGRMATFAGISIIPFYLFFHEEYFYRQNIIFDLWLALLALCFLNDKKIKKPLGILMVAGLFVVSALIGGWVILPIVYVLVFYYSDTFQKKAGRFLIVTGLFEIILILLIRLNQTYHFSKYEWTVAERLYLLGFVFALIPLRFYNGQKGRSVRGPIAGRYFFYIFYPAHFLVLYAIKCLQTATPQQIYIGSHVVALIVALALFLYVLNQPVSRAQVGVAFFLISGMLYIYGFLLEITSSEVAGVYTATKMQYFAEVLVFISITFCIQELAHVRIPKVVYSLEITFSVYAMYALYTYKENGLFYTGISMNTTVGPFPRMEIEGYGPVFYMFVGYSALVCVMLIGLGLYAAHTGGRLLKKRFEMLLIGMIMMWMAYLIKPLNLTNGYEIPAIFIPITAFFVARALVRYSFLDSISLDFSNAFQHGKEGILILDRNHKVLYYNEWMHKILGSFHRLDDAYEIENVEKIVTGELTKLEVDEYTVEFRVEPLVEQGYHTGDIIWAIDLTEHYEKLEQAKEDSENDFLTGIHNRKWFEETVNACLKEKRVGAFFMVDLDHFKNVNDNHGHKIGDLALRLVGESMNQVIEKEEGTKIHCGRMGGDEFCMYVENVTDRAKLGKLAAELILTFEQNLKAEGHPGITGLSVGIARILEEDMEDEALSFDVCYERADGGLYAAKKAGRGTFRFAR